MQFPLRFLIFLHSLASAGGKTKLSRAYQLEVLQYCFHRRSHIQLVVFSSIFQTRYRTKEAHAGDLRPYKKYQKLVKIKQNRRDSKLLQQREKRKRRSKKLLRTSQLLLHQPKNESSI